jgi:Zn-dependent peptidase ImmA (M78 family)
MFVDERELIHDGDPHVGHISYDKSNIRISRELDEYGRRVTLWHELLHAIIAQAGRENDSVSEQDIEALAHGIVEVLERNKGKI